MSRPSLVSRWFRVSAVAELPSRLVRGFASKAPTPDTHGTSLFSRLKQWHVARVLCQSLTGVPFRFDRLTDVQERVFSLFPDIAKSSTMLPDGQGRDLLCKARTGTGKTVAFLVPAIQARLNALENIDKNILTPSFERYMNEKYPADMKENLSPKQLKHIKSIFRRESVGTLVISPTRELAMQIAEEAKKLVRDDHRIGVHLLVGGVKSIRQRRPWEMKNRDIVVATPGRLLDLMSMPMFRDSLSTTQTLVLDEADMLLEMGFREDIQSIIAQLPSVEERMTFLFSATMDADIAAIARASLHEQHRVIDCVPPGEDNVHTKVPQMVTTLGHPNEALPHLLRLISHDQLLHGSDSKIMIFTPTTKTTDMLYKILQDMQPAFPTTSETRVFRIHSSLDQAKRSKISQQFRQCKSQPNIMVTSDVSARGVDYPSVTRVIQLGVPPSKEMYVHRVGRTGRRGRDGRADLVISDFENAFVAFELSDIPVVALDQYEFEQEVLDLASSSHSAVRDRLQDAELGRIIAAAQTRVDPTNVQGVFSSLFGYYYSMRQLLRTANASILHAVQDWVVGLVGLDSRPAPTWAMRQMLSSSSSSQTTSKKRSYTKKDRSFSKPFSRTNQSGYPKQKHTKVYKAPF